MQTATWGYLPASLLAMDCTVKDAFIVQVLT